MPFNFPRTEPFHFAGLSGDQHRLVVKKLAPSSSLKLLTVDRASRKLLLALGPFSGNISRLTYCIYQRPGTGITAGSFITIEIDAVESVLVTPSAIHHPVYKNCHYFPHLCGGSHRFLWRLLESIRRPKHFDIYATNWGKRLPRRERPMGWNDGHNLTDHLRLGAALVQTIAIEWLSQPPRMTPFTENLPWPLLGLVEGMSSFSLNTSHISEDRRETELILQHCRPAVAQSTHLILSFHTRLRLRDQLITHGVQFIEQERFPTQHPFGKVAVNCVIGLPHLICQFQVEKL
ncbi:unnamed protein product, partial [Mesorhabditis spiculigera]